MKKILSFLLLTLSLPLLALADNSASLTVTQNSQTSYTLSFGLKNTTTGLNGFQVDVVLPEGVTADIASLQGTARVGSLTLQANTLESGNLRIVGYSSSSSARILGSSGSILSIQLNTATPLANGTYEVRAKNIRISTSTQETVLPAVTGSFTVEDSGEYTLNYWFDDELYYTFTLKMGDPIPAVEDLPDKGGYSFCGWGDVPQTMPACNLDLRAQWCVKYFTLSYSSQGKIVHTASVAYGQPLPEFTPQAPEGYDFCGWGDAPETMPAQDLTIYARMCLIHYMLSYKINGEVVHTVDMTYGQPIQEYDPQGINGFFLGWGDVPELMPAHDLELTGKVVPFGDVNLDGKINTADVVAIYNYIIDGEDSGIRLLYADVNGDANVNTADVVAIYNIITGNN